MNQYYNIQRRHAEEREETRGHSHKSDGGPPTDAFEIKGLSVRISSEKEGHLVTDPKNGVHWV